jgi:hypothetical protein
MLKSNCLGGGGVGVLVGGGDGLLRLGGVVLWVVLGGLFGGGLGCGCGGAGLGLAGGGLLQRGQIQSGYFFLSLADFSWLHFR